MKKRSLGFILMLLALAMILLAACGGGDNKDSKNNDSGNNGNADTEEPANQDDGEKDDVELRIVTTMAGTDPTAEVFQELLEEFKEDNPHVKITDESQTADAGTIRTKINTDFTSDNEPEIMFYFNTVDAEGIIDAGKVIDLENAEGVNLDDFNTGMYEQQRYKDGKLYAAPQTGFYEAIFVNEALFEEHGIELPTTWELYEKAIEEFAKTDIIPIAVSTEDSYYLVEHYALAAGGMENYEAELSDRNEKWAEGLDKIAEHAAMGAFPADAATIDLALAENLFHQEQAAMLFEGSWAWGGVIEQGLEDRVTVLPMPVYGDGETGELVGGASSGWFISTKAYEDDTKRDATVDLFNYLTSKENVLRLAGATGQVPAKGELADIEDYLQVGHALVADAPAIAEPINDRILPEAFTHIRTSVPQIVNGEKTGEDIINEAADLE